MFIAFSQFYTIRVFELSLFALRFSFNDKTNNLPFFFDNINKIKVMSNFLKLNKDYNFIDFKKFNNS